MIYRKLGRTGLKVSQLGFGAMRLPMCGDGDRKRVDLELAVPMIHRAFEAGVNYIDTAVGYCHRDSQRAVGEALKGRRKKIVVSTKNHNYGEDEKQWWQNLEDSLELLGVERIDIYNHHGISWQRFTEAVQPRISKWMLKARDQGLIKHICCSFHDTNDALVKLADSGYPEVITLQYNMLDRRLEQGIAYAAKKGIGVVVMGPVGGGRLGATSKVLEKLLPAVKRVPELALRFVLANPNVSVAISGMSTIRHVEENLATAADAVSLSDADRAEIDKHLARLEEMARLYCTGCRYCTPCPSEVNIPSIFEKFNWGRVYGLWDIARQRYNQIGKVPWDKGNKADACKECGECEEKCPQKIPIREQLKEAHKVLVRKA
ncbi:MAG: aldo/keto reductase [Planctomycetota bacterium]|jgi:predicted aldo/keto reductase-like oxidoreductase